MIADRESMTARLCSFARAHHAENTQEKIFDDFLAFDFMGNNQYEELSKLVENGFCGRCNVDETGVCEAYLQSIRDDRERMESLLNRYITPIPISRDAFSQDALSAFLKRHSKCQVVICGAGMDTFSFRNANRNVEVFELDHPDTQRFKRDRVRELGWDIPFNAHFVSVDFSREDMRKKLYHAGFNTRIPSFFTILGVTYYISLEVFGETLRNIAVLGRHSETEVVFDFPDDELATGSARGRELAEITAMLGEPMEPGYPVQDLRSLLTEKDFAIRKHYTSDQIQENYFAGRGDGLSAFEHVHFVLASHRIPEKTEYSFVNYL